MIWLIFALLASLSTAILNVVSKIGLHYLDPVVMTTLQTFVTSIVLMGIVMYSNVSVVYENQTLYSLFIIIVGIVANIFSYIFFTYAIKYGPVIHVSTIYLLNLPLTIFISALMLHEQITLKIIIGTSMMLCGAVFLTL